ncbi:MAG TPA: hypothetical protein VGM20_00100 [Gemmatimonadales bacterium]|jgi:hypothetical protein
MNSHDPQHLTADELDAFLTESSSPRVLSHLGTCPTCALMVESDARLVASLATLPYFDPPRGFEERVLLAASKVASARAAILTPRAKAARPRALMALVVGLGSIAAGFAWATLHPADAIRVSMPELQQAAQAAWLSLQASASHAATEPWFLSIRETVAAPGRALLFFLGGTGLYTVALTGFRRLMAEPTTDAGW